MQKSKAVVLVLIVLLVGLASGLLGRGIQDQHPSSTDVVAPAGRYQLVVTDGSLYIFDTQAGRLWERGMNGPDPPWTEHSPDYGAAGRMRNR